MYEQSPATRGVPLHSSERKLITVISDSEGGWLLVHNFADVEARARRTGVPGEAAAAATQCILVIDW